MLLVWLGFSCVVSAGTAGAGEEGSLSIWKDRDVTDFDAFHSPADGDERNYLIFGNIPMHAPGEQLAPKLSAFLGRWEGYDSGSPVKLVLVIQEISEDGGTAFLWAGTNLQHPSDLKEIHFTVLPGEAPSIAWDAVWGMEPDNQIIEGGLEFSYQLESGELRGGIWFSPDKANKRPIVLTRDRNFWVARGETRDDELQSASTNIPARQEMDLPEVLAFYREYGVYTDPGEYESLLADLPESLEELCTLIKAQFIHPVADLAPYRNRIPPERHYEDPKFPTTAALLAGLLEHNPAGLIPERLPEERLVVTCRYHAILLASILKSRGVPTRVRYGFARYLAPGRHIYHVICEVWNEAEQRWMLVDPDRQLVDFPRKQFDSAADIWLQYQQGLNVSGYGVGNWWGPYAVLDMLCHDFVSLQGRELLYWDRPPLTVDERMDVTAVPAERVEILDRIAELMLEPEKHLQELRSLYDAHQFLQF